MDSAERIFLYSKGLKHHIRIEVERAMPPSLESAMIIANRMDGIYSQRSTFSRNPNRPFRRSFGNQSGSSNGGSTPMEIGFIPSRYNRPMRNLSDEEKKRYMESKLCFGCGKKGCRPWKHGNHGRKTRRTVARNRPDNGEH